MKLLGWLVPITVFLAGGVALLFTLDLLPHGTPPEVLACEAHIKSGLTAPTTYSRVSVTTHDEAMIDDLALQKAAGIAPPRPKDLDYRVWRLGTHIYDGQPLVLRRVGIEYDSQNAFGVPIRGREVCGFRVVGGEVKTKGSTGLSDGWNTLAALKGWKRRPEPAFTCCL